MVTAVLATGDCCCTGAMAQILATNPKQTALVTPGYIACVKSRSVSCLLPWQLSETPCYSSWHIPRLSL